MGTVGLWDGVNAVAGAGSATVLWGQRLEAPWVTLLLHSFSANSAALPTLLTRPPAHLVEHFLCVNHGCLVGCLMCLDAQVADGRLASGVLWRW